MSWAKVQSFGRELVLDPITRAFLVSLLLHIAAIAGVEFGRQIGLWDRSVFSLLANHDLVQEVVKTAEQRAELQKQMEQREPPEAELVFVDVDPSQAVTEPPKDAKYYSMANTVAANRTRDDEKQVPKLEGTQDKVPKTTDTLRPDPRAAQATPPPEKEKPKPEVMQPTPQPVKPAPEVKPAPRIEPKPQPAVEKGETLYAKAEPREASSAAQPNNPPPEEPPKRRRPASLAEAKAQKGIIEGPKFRQHGGARIALTDGLDVKATPFGTYDAMFIEAVQSRWFSLLEDRNVGSEAGKVVVEFRLHQDGRITDLSVVDASVGELLSWFCQRAILDPSPYHPFPPDLRRMMNTDYREIRFTFYYNQ